MIVLGVDPGTIRTGWGIAKRVGPKIVGVAAGVIETGKDHDLSYRLRTIYSQLMMVIQEYQPSTMALEDIFFSHSAKAALLLGHARGVALLAGANSELEVHAYPPTLVKRSIAGRGRAPKEQVSQMVGTIVGWKELPSTDATDALAVAITHLNATHLPIDKSYRHRTKG